MEASSSDSKPTRSLHVGFWLIALSLVAFIGLASLFEWLMPLLASLSLAPIVASNLPDSAQGILAYLIAFFIPTLVSLLGYWYSDRWRQLDSNRTFLIRLPFLALLLSTNDALGQVEVMLSAKVWTLTDTLVNWSFGIIGTAIGIWALIRLIRWLICNEREARNPVAAGEETGCKRA